MPQIIPTLDAASDAAASAQPPAQPLSCTPTPSPAVCRHNTYLALFLPHLLVSLGWYCRLDGFVCDRFCLPCVERVAATKMKPRALVMWRCCALVAMRHSLACCMRAALPGFARPPRFESVVCM